MGLLAFIFTATIMGWVIFSYYKVCDPVSDGVIMSADQVESRYALSWWTDYFTPLCFVLLCYSL